MTDEQPHDDHSTDPFVTYEMTDGSQVFEEYQFVVGTEWFDDRDEPIDLIRRTYRLVSEERITLPDPNPIEEDDDNIE